MFLYEQWVVPGLCASMIVSGRVYPMTRAQWMMGYFVNESTSHSSQ